MNVAPRCFLFSAILILSLMLAGCSDENNQFIQGTWDRSDVHILDYWVFNGSTYLQKSGLHMNNPRVQSGSYYVAESEEGRLVIELIPEQNNLGFSVEPYDLLITIDIETDTESTVKNSPSPGPPCLHAANPLLILNPFNLEIHIPEQAYQRLSDLKSDGKTAVIVALDYLVIGILGISDPIRHTTKTMIDSLRAGGLDKIIMLTGYESQP